LKIAALNDAEEARYSTSKGYIHQWPKASSTRAIDRPRFRQILADIDDAAAPAN
jgi:hypothetical protein